MRERLFRFSVSLLFFTTIAAAPAGSLDGCPSHVVVGETACHLVSGTNCKLCEYNCNGSHVWWDMCGET